MSRRAIKYWDIKRDYYIQKFSRNCKRAKLGTSTVEVDESLQIKWYKNTMNSEEYFLTSEISCESNESNISLAPEPNTTEINNIKITMIQNDDYRQLGLSLAPEPQIINGKEV